MAFISWPEGPAVLEMVISAADIGHRREIEHTMQGMIDYDYDVMQQCKGEGRVCMMW